MPRLLLNSVFTLAILAVLGQCGCSGLARSVPTVAFLTDYGSRDAYVGVLYGAVLSRCPDAKLVPITHEVPDFDIPAASYLLSMAAKAYPVGTVFCTVVDPTVGTKRRSIILRTRDGMYFVGPDNGTFTDVIRSQGLDGAWAIDEAGFAGTSDLSSTFHGRDIYGPIAGLLAAGTPPQRIGTPIEDPVMLSFPKPQRDGNTLVGAIRYIDGYGNIMTNIPADWLPVDARESRLPVTVDIGGVSKPFVCAGTYGDVRETSGVVLRNARGRCEVSRNLASAKAWFPHARIGASVRIELSASPGA